MSHDEYETELTGSRADIAAAIHGVADGVRAGAIRLGDTEDGITVDTPASLSLELELETDDDEVSLELELEWPAGAVAAATESDAVPDVEATAPETESEAEAAPSDAAQSGDADADRPGESDGQGALEADTHDPGTDTDSPQDATAVPTGAADASQSLARFEVFEDSAEEWRWRLRHRNGNVIATSGEGYTRKHNAWKGLRSVMANSPNAAVVEEPTE